MPDGYPPTGEATVTALLELIIATAEIARLYLTGPALWTAADLLERAVEAAERGDEQAVREALAQAVPLR